MKNNIIILGIATLVVIINGIIGHFFPPNGIELTPIVLTITTLLVCLKIKHTNLIYISIFTFIFIALNDILIKLYAGGRHDYEGLAWILLFLLIGLIPTSIILFSTIFRRKDETLKTKIISGLLFIGLVSIHLLLFDNLGITEK